MSIESQFTGHVIRRQLSGAGFLAAAEDQPSSFSADLRLFATFWLGGIVFFGTFLA